MKSKNSKKRNKRLVAYKRIRAGSTKMKTWSASSAMHSTIKRFLKHLDKL